VRRTQTLRTIVSAAVLAIVVAGLFVAMVGAVSAGRDASRQARQSDDEIAAALEEQKLVIDLETSLRGFLLSRSPGFLRSWHAGMRAMPAAQRRLGTTVDDPITIALAGSIHQGIASYIGNHGEPLLHDRSPLSRSRLAAETQEGNQRIDALRGRFARLIAHERAESAAARIHADDQSRRALLFGVLGLAGSLVLVLLFAGYQLTFVLLPVRRVGAAARRLAGGDLTIRVAQTGSGEVGELGRAFNGMADALEHSRDELESQNSELEAQQGELERAVDELAYEKDRVEDLYRIGRAISGGTDLEAVGATIVEQLCELARAEIGVVYVTSANDSDVAPVVSARGIDTAALPPVKRNAGLAGRALAEGRSVTAAHGATGLRVPAMGTEVAIAHELHLPLLNGSTVVGVLTLARLSGGPFSTADQQQLDYLGGRAGASIANALTLRVLSDQAALNRAVLDTAADAFVTIDHESVVRAWNPAAERLFGWTAEEIIGQRLRDTVVPGRHLEMHDRLTSGRDIAAMSGVPLELDARHRDGHEFPIELIVSPLERDGELTFNSFMRDITARRRSERHMGAHLAVTRALSESPTLAGARVAMIKALCEALGWSVGVGWLADHDTGLLSATTVWAADGIVADSFRELTLATSFQRGQGLPGRVWATGEPVWIEDLRRDAGFSRTAAADRAGLRSAIAFPVIAGDQFIGLLEFFSDQPERPDPELMKLLTTIGSQISEFSKRKRAELEADRLKDEFFALVSHELRTPLTSIIGYLELVLENSDQLDPETGRFLQVVDRNSRRLQRLVGDLLFVAQVEAGRLSLDRAQVSVERVLEDCVEAARPRAEENGVVLSASIHEVGSTEGDCDRIGQMLDNIVSNAIKFTPGGGRVDVDLRRRGDRALIEVRDSGVGIPEDEQPQLFQRFFRSSTATERAIPGVGLGLTISRAIAEAHGGTISFTSEEGSGATFTVDLPLSSPQRANDPSTSPREVVL
jgi:PAS domain S-box-containing protein